jgi:NitT/TauT family transport system permease protein
LALAWNLFLGESQFLTEDAERKEMKKLRSFISSYWLTVVTVVLLISGYVAYTSAEGTNKFLFPDLTLILGSLAANWQLMFTNMFYSFTLIIPSICISLSLALLLGILLGRNARLRKAFYPIVYTFSVIPAILLSPVALMVAHSFTSASIFLIVYGTVWSTLFSTITGIMSIDRRYLDKAKTLNITGFKLVRRVILPAASPTILGGFTNSLRSSFVMLVFAEMYGAQQGMGFFVKKYAEMNIYKNTWAGVLFMAIVLVLVMQVYEHVKSYILRWTT